ncbi:N-acetylmuramoyl-L-alanine amidase [Enterococcus sp. PF1-24]|uniref:N-acetylmuramoyl-L-alanine amidase n=1 Tax=unclassified Enterococcus TaxID=2608891 RepID=UPI00247337D5|nr:MULTISPECIES: N-acetylmuramoyl-L-alanine amidase [unclassified Enterococcus]MDH6363625.1 N-acetylmuramoyl-L-alanine amidase [Enterococcus sp. PFB1-1]MDH6400860.1 N-acetylmuramoyl-L-alanine amidase [Enterococcus sp. PF1-24]
MENMEKKNVVSPKLLFAMFIFVLIIVTIGLGWWFDRTYSANKKTNPEPETTEVKKEEIKYIEKVQINKVETTADPNDNQEIGDGLADTSDTENYIPLYAAANSDSTIIEDVFTGEWADYLGEESDFVNVRTKNGNSGFIAKEQADVTKLIDRKSVNSIKDAVIVLDAGHGGTDIGAESTNTVYLEKDFTLATAEAVQKALEEAGATVYMTRTTDTDMTLDERTELSKKYAPDAFISLHYDSSDYSDTFNGYTTYYYYQRDQALAEAISHGLGVVETRYGADGTALSLPNLGVKTDNFSVTRESPYPSLLLELGYINSYGDLIVIWDDEYYKQVAEGITTALTKYFSGENPIATINSTEESTTLDSITE